MIEIATLLSALVHKWKDFSIILVILLANAGLNFSSSSILGVAGVISSFLLFYILLEIKFSSEMIQLLFFVKRTVIGHGTIYNTRTDDLFWKNPIRSSFFPSVYRELCSPSMAYLLPPSAGSMPYGCGPMP